MSFGTWLREERTRRGLTQRALAALSDGGVSSGMVARLENDDVGYSQAMILRIADALAGPDADEDERESLRREALAASVGMEYPAKEMQRSVLMERWGGRYDGLTEDEALLAAAESHLDLLMDLREAQRRAAIGGTGEPKKPEE